MATITNKDMVNKKRLSAKSVIKTTALYVGLTLITLIIAFPFFVLLSRSFMTDAEISSFDVKIFPTALSLNPYKKAFDTALSKYIFNTLVIILCNCIFIPFTAALSAYAFAKLKFAGKEIIFFIALCTTMLPTIVTQIPLYTMYTKLNWLDTYLPLIIPGLFGGGALNIFLIRQYMRVVPNSIMEAAQIDGCGWFMFFVRFMIPLAKPVIVLVAVQTFMATWNDFTSPLIYINDESKFTLSVGVYMKFLQDSGGEFLHNQRMATGVIMSIPLIVIFFFFQKQLIEGVSLSGIKS